MKRIHIYKRKRKPHTAVYEICHPDTGEVLFTGDAPKAAAFVGLVTSVLSSPP